MFWRKYIVISFVARELILTQFWRQSLSNSQTICCFDVQRNFLLNLSQSSLPGSTSRIFPSLTKAKKEDRDLKIRKT